mgnify:CR=1 FL=1
MSHNVYLYILVMAIVTYLIRMLPLALAKTRSEARLSSPFCIMCHMPVWQP